MSKHWSVEAERRAVRGSGGRKAPMGGMRAQFYHLCRVANKRENEREGEREREREK